MLCVHKDDSCLVLALIVPLDIQKFNGELIINCDKKHNISTQSLGNDKSGHCIVIECDKNKLSRLAHTY